MTIDEDLTGTTGDLLAGLALFREASVPEPGPALRELFAAARPVGAAVPSAIATPSVRRLPVYKRILTGLPSKVAAGTLGFLLAGSVGAGALTGTMVLTSNDEVEVVEVVDEGSDRGDDEATDDGATAVEEGETGANDAAGAVDLAAVPVPTVVSDAAQTHDFDEACGNHGMYVSYFAQFGEEPPCATEARAAGANEEEVVDDVSVDPAEAGVEDEKAEQKAARTEARSDRQSAKADARSARKASGKSGKGGR